MEPELPIKARRGGRPLSFDRAVALKKAMMLFWRHGYEATSVADLTAAMGISPPSLYAAFGDKKRLFLEAVELYMGGGSAAAEAIAAAPSARAAAEGLLRTAIEVYTGGDTPPGCLVTSAAASCSAAAADVQEALASIRREVEAALRTRIAVDVASGVLPAGTDAVALAKLCLTLTQGMSTQARDGASRDHLLALVDLAMRAWPAEAS